MVCLGMLALPSGHLTAATTAHVAAGTVLDAPGKGPQLCLGTVQLSLPPRCSGPAVVGWDWTALVDKETWAGTTWGQFIVAGNFDPTTFTFTLTEPPEPATPDILEDEWQLPDTTTSCDKPKGGWPVKGRISDVDADRLLAWLARNPDLGGAWVDFRSRYRVLNVRFARNPRTNRIKLRKRYRGNLCLVTGGPTRTRLVRTQRDVTAAIPAHNRLDIAIDDRAGHVSVDVVFDEGTLTRDFDARFGAGMVEVRSHIRTLSVAERGRRVAVPGTVSQR